MAATGNDWLPALRAEFKKPYCAKLYHFIKNEHRTEMVYPAADRIFEALVLTPLEKVRVVILGQDPYHKPNQTHELTFLVLPMQPVIPSPLKDIYRELHGELGCYISNNGCLKKRAGQGAPFLNAVLTMHAYMVLSHQNQGWGQFADAILAAANQSKYRLVFLFWGRPVQEKLPMLNTSRHLVLIPPRPSPLSVSRGFFGRGHFQKTSELPQSVGGTPTDWQIESI